MSYRRRSRKPQPSPFAKVLEDFSKALETFGPGLKSVSKDEKCQTRSTSPSQGIAGDAKGRTGRRSAQ